MTDKSNVFYERKGYHGTPNLPFARYSTIIPEFCNSYPMHWHEDIEIVIAWKGCCRYFVDFKEYLLKEGDILVISPSMLHAFEQYNDSQYRGDTFVYSLSMLNFPTDDLCSTNIIRPLLKGDKILQPLISKDSYGYLPIRENLIKTITQMQINNDYFEIILKSLMMEFFYLCANSGYIIEKDSSLPFSGKYIKDVIEYINKNYASQITLEDIASYAGVTPCHLAKAFKKATGTTCFSYINDIRLSNAYEQLKKTNESVLSIAIENGFNNISYFNRAFKKKYSCTPLECRNMN